MDLYRCVAQLADEVLPNANDPTDVMVSNGRLVRISPLGGETITLESLQSASPPLVPTNSSAKFLAFFDTWLEEGVPMIVSGPPGCGKTQLIQDGIRRFRDKRGTSLNVAVLHCNAQTSSSHVLLKLKQYCGISNGAQGRIFRPKEVRRLVLLLKDINLPKPDKYDTSQIISFLQQLVMYQGFYDDDLEFVHLENVQIVCSMAASDTLGRHHVSTRFTSNVRLCTISPPTKDELVDIYAAYLRCAIHESVARDVTKLSEAMVSVYSSMCIKFSVDDHEHYLFCPRNLTHWVLQLLRYEISSPDDLVNAWAHAACRIFRDKLVGDDATIFDDILASECYNQFGRQVDMQKIIYTSLLSRDNENNVPTGILQQIPRPDYHRMVEQCLKQYSRDVRDLDVEVFDEVLNRFSNVECILSGQDNNDILMVGRQGVGRRSTVTVMAHLMNMQIFTPNQPMKYGWKEWKRDLKQVMHMTGVEQQHTMLFLEDHQILPEFIEVINSLLSAGEIPGLYTPEELEPLLLLVKDDWQQKENSARNTFEFFVQRVRSYLRVVLSMDPSHAHFLPICAANPAIFTSCNVMWLNDWMRGNMELVVQKKIAQFEKADLQNLMLKVYESQVPCGATLRHFISLLESCVHVYTTKSQAQSGHKSHLRKGLDKLREVHDKVDQLQRDASQKQQELQEKQKLAQESLVKIRDAMTRAAERKNEVESLSKKTAEDEALNREEKEVIECQLAEIQPILDGARKAVGSIKPDHLNEIRSLKMPPDPIADVLSGVLRLMGNYDASWASMRKFLGGTGVIQRILNYDMRNISPEIRREVAKLLKEKANSFDQQVIYRVSVAAAPLAKWVVATVKYSEVLEKITPMEKRLTKANDVLAVAQQRLDECREELRLIDVTVQDLQNEFNDRTREAEVLRLDLQRSNDILTKARSLMDKLGGEKSRWEKQTGEIQRHADQLPVFSVMAAGYITHLGHFGEDIRAEQLGKWMGYAEEIGHTHSRISEDDMGFNFIKFLATESELLTYKAQGLPTDELSQENALIITKSLQVPFLIDPNSQAINWLRKHLVNSECVLQQDPKIAQHIELAVRFGKILIVQEMDGLPAMIFPTLRRDLTRQGPRLVIQVGEKLCDYNDTFSLYLCSRNSNAFESLPPNASCLVSRVNFTVTRAGLEGQLLGITLEHEKPDLEMRKSELLHKEEDLKLQLAECEEELLIQLADSTGDVLENTKLITSLEDTKTKSVTIMDALEESTKLQESLDSQREVYRGLAHLGSNLFILLRDLTALDYMYRFALRQFTVLFKKVLQRKTASESVEEKLDSLGSALKIEVLFFVARSLFKKDRLTFAMHFVRHIMPPNFFGANEREFFQGTYVPLQESSQCPPWVPQSRASPFKQLLAVSPKLVDLFNGPDRLWEQWMQSDRCEETFENSVYQNSTAFQRLLIIQSLRPDRLETAMNQFVIQVLGVSSLSPPPLSLVRLHDDEMTCTEPVLFVTTPGADPSIELEEFAKTKQVKLHQLAMGGGNQEYAMQLLREAAPRGEWICLKNLHLVMVWVPLLEKEIKSLEPHPDFRCWLTTEPHSRFPPILLESALKVTYEAPPGIKKNLLRTFESWTPGWFGRGPNIRAQVIFLCAHFHAIMQERRTFIPQGWTKFYEFSQGDLTSACETVNLLVSGEQMDWTTLIGVLDNAVYGSRVDNDFDLRLVREYLTLFFRPETLAGKKACQWDIPAIDIPKGSVNMADFRVRVEQLPDVENPRSFGMAPNVDRSLQRTNSNMVISNLRQLSTHAAFSKAQGGGVDVKLWQEHLHALWKFWDHWLKTQYKNVAKIPLRSVRGEDSPIVAFIIMDAQATFELCDIISAALSSIQKVCMGTGLSTPDLQAIAQCLISTEVPDVWLTSWPSAPEQPMSFLQGLSRRAFKLKSEWIPRLDGQLFDHPISLNDFLRPDVFLNALRQQSARTLGTSVESLHIISSFGKFTQSERLAEHTVYLQGLFLEGCMFDETQSLFIESERTSNLVSPLPVLSVAWSPQSLASHTVAIPGASMVRLPIYVRLSREHFLVDVLMQSDSARARIFNSAAIFLTDSQ